MIQYLKWMYIMVKIDKYNAYENYQSDKKYFYETT